MDVEAERLVCTNHTCGAEIEINRNPATKKPIHVRRVEVS